MSTVRQAPSRDTPMPSGRTLHDRSASDGWTKTVTPHVTTRGARGVADRRDPARDHAWRRGVAHNRDPACNHAWVRGVYQNRDPRVQRELRKSAHYGYNVRC